MLNRCFFDSVELSKENVATFLGFDVCCSIQEEERMRVALKSGTPLFALFPDAKVSFGFKNAAAKLMNVEYYSPLRKVSLLEKLGLVS